ncbi:DUF4189 domain-containing protein [Mycobacterium sp. NPDC048908]|uniref:DUF4189 domain-containing protein n=1 Tax=Mycobacterium sp. NPDC048908 TaxID=3364292 RepID=UPI00370F9179
MAGLGLSAGVADAGPFCYETGPGFEKCLDSPTGDYFHPIYQGPKLDDRYIPWVPSADPPPVIAPTSPPVNTNGGLSPAATAGCPEGSYVDPSNLNACLAATPGNDYISLAASSSNPELGGYGMAASQGQADEIAIAECTARTNSACQVAARAFHACAAYALGANGIIAGGVGPDPSAASADALHGAPGGRAAGGKCSEPPGN